MLRKILYLTLLICPNLVFAIDIDISDAWILSKDNYNNISIYLNITNNSNQDVTIERVTTDTSEDISFYKTIITKEIASFLKISKILIPKHSMKKLKNNRIFLYIPNAKTNSSKFSVNFITNANQKFVIKIDNSNIHLLN